MIIDVPDIYTAIDYNDGIVEEVDVSGKFDTLGAIFCNSTVMQVKISKALDSSYAEKIEKGFNFYKNVNSKQDYYKLSAKIKLLGIKTDNYWSDLTKFFTENELDFKLQHSMIDNNFIAILFVYEPCEIETNDLVRGSIIAQLKKAKDDKVYRLSSLFKYKVMNNRRKNEDLMTVLNYITKCLFKKDKLFKVYFTESKIYSVEYVPSPCCNTVAKVSEYSYMFDLIQRYDWVLEDGISAKDDIGIVLCPIFSFGIDLSKRIIW